MKTLQLSLLACILTVSLLAHPGAARAQTGLALEIFNTVNALRASRGLVPYTWDSGLEVYALAHCQYMVSTGKFTHVHSDGSLPWQNGMQENIATGTSSFMTAAFVVHTIWADEIHMKPMVGYAGGSVGVGVVYNGANVIITLDMRGAGATSTTSTPTGATPGTAGTPAAIARAAATPTTASIPGLLPRQTTTARPDGSQVHEVGYGQTLVTIASMYGVTVDDIRRLNGMPAGSSDIWAGQKLLIRPAQPSPTPSLTLVVTASVAASATPAPTATNAPTSALLPAPAGFADAAALPRAPSPTSTPVSTPPPEAEPLSTRQVGLLILGAAALAAAGYLGSQIIPGLRR